MKKTGKVISITGLSDSGKTIVGINGFGRIGRIVTRLLSSDSEVTPVFVNDLDPDIENLAYLFNYDSNYG